MIEAHDLSKQFNDFWAVQDVNLSVRPGQILALLGQNGAGKTTTVRMLTGLLVPSRGWARVAGFDVVRQGRQVRAAVGVLTEQHGLYARMTGWEYLDFFAQVYGLAAGTRAARSAYLLDYFGLAQASAQRIGQYSKGMRQKLALARALLHEPPVLLLDEPTSAMDPESARLVRNEIARLKSSQRSIVICTHNLVEAEALADLIAIIYRGRILMTGTLDDLKQRVLGTPEYEATFASPWEAPTSRLPQGAALLERSPLSMRFRLEDPRSANPLIVQGLAAQGAPLLSFQETPRSLEQVYLKVMADAQAAPREPVHAR
jgi:ABC-2 type transport system ATP-binding protein